MATESIVSRLDGPIAARPRFSILSSYWALTKPEVNFLIVIATFAGFYLGYAGGWHGFAFLRAINAVLGTLLVASGTGTLNQYMERGYDAQMRRTSRRPLAAGQLKASAVLWFGIALSIIGSVYLALTTNLLASVLAIATLLSYLFVYTPLKRRTPLCTLIGAFPGAMPPLIGWAAASGKLSADAWILYAVLFLWQFPHFMAIAWMYRDDYARAGYRVLPQDGETRRSWVDFQTLVPLLILVLLNLLLALTSDSSLYLIGALLFSAGFLHYGVQFVLRRSNTVARRLLSASIIYLPSLFVLMIVSRS